MRSQSRSVRVTALLSCLGVLAFTTALAQTTATFNLPAQPLAESLRAVASQTNNNILFDKSLVSRISAKSLKARLSVQDALKTLLSGTGLTYKYLDERTLTIVSAASSKTEETSATKPIAGDVYPSARRIAQSSEDADHATQNDSSAPPLPSSTRSENRHKGASSVEEVVVTGSRLRETSPVGPQNVKIYTRAKIEQSGQTTVADFLNTLPDVSIANGESPQSGMGIGTTTVQLHGLPVGTTLILINGRRTEQSGVSQAGSGGPFFDLNTIPLSAIERIEVVAEGSSAVYGSDAIAGVVNIILRQNVDGFEANIKYGGASGTDERDGTLAWGERSDRGSISIIGSIQARTELKGSDRAIAANNDYTSLGGRDARFYACNPGNVFSKDGGNLPGVGAPYAAVPAGFTGTPTQQEFAGTAGSLNKCSFFAYESLIPRSTREGVFAYGDYELTPGIQLFTEQTYSHTQQDVELFPPFLFAIPGFQSFSVSASNPFNPFGETVGIGGLLTGLGRQASLLDTVFVRSLIGARGRFGTAWQWEFAAWDAEDRSRLTQTNGADATAIQNALNSADPASALNPFVVEPQGSAQLLQSLRSDQLTKYSSRTLAVNSFARGPLFNMPAGAVEMVFGGEYEGDALYQDEVNVDLIAPNTKTNFKRDRYALFGEARVPVIGKRGNVEEPLAVTLAGRFDHYSDFGESTTPQLGLEWRPLNSLLVRGAYGRAFRAPGLSELHAAQSSFPGIVSDPKNGDETEAVTVITGGNPNLRPETGSSRTFGFVYSSEAVPGLRVSVTHWAIDERGSIQLLTDQGLIDNESLFPGNVVRDASGALSQVTDTFVNFGEINVSGFSYQMDYRTNIGPGELQTAIGATQTTKYSVALTPGSPSVDSAGFAQDTGNWAPRWKGNITLGWRQGPCNAVVTGRYVGRYQDYDRTVDIGNFWLYDLNIKYALGQVIAPRNARMNETYFELGGVNVLNSSPQFSNFGGGGIGYDPAEADIRGRFIYARVGIRF